MAFLCSMGGLPLATALRRRLATAFWRLRFRLWFWFWLWFRLWFRLWLRRLRRLGCRSRSRRWCRRWRRDCRQRLQERGAVRTTPTAARIPSWTGAVIAIITGRDVVECSRILGKALVQVRIQVAHGVAQRLIEERNQAGPQRGHSAGSSHGKTRAVHLDLVAGRRVGIAGNVGKPPAFEVPRILGWRHIGIGLPRREGEGIADPATGCATIGKIVPYDFARNRTAAETE